LYQLHREDKKEKKVNNKLRSKTYRKQQILQDKNSFLVFNKPSMNATRILANTVSHKAIECKVILQKHIKEQ
jgi:hypothetical protein